jgi:hypothetical protein
VEKRVSGPSSIEIEAQRGTYKFFGVFDVKFPDRYLELCRQVIVQFLPERVVASIHVRFYNLIASAGTGMISEGGPDLPLKNKDNLDPVLRLRRS